MKWNTAGSGSRIAIPVSGGKETAHDYLQEKILLPIHNRGRQERKPNQPPNERRVKSNRHRTEWLAWLGRWYPG